MIARQKTRIASDSRQHVGWVERIAPERLPVKKTRIASDSQPVKISSETQLLNLKVVVKPNFTLPNTYG